MEIGDYEFLLWIFASRADGRILITHQEESSVYECSRFILLVLPVIYSVGDSYRQPLLPPTVSTLQDDKPRNMLDEDATAGNSQMVTAAA